MASAVWRLTEWLPGWLAAWLTSWLYEFLISSALLALKLYFPNDWNLAENLMNIFKSILLWLVSLTNEKTKKAKPQNQEIICLWYLENSTQSKCRKI